MERLRPSVTRHLILRGRRQAGRQTDRQAGRQADRQTDRQTDRQIDRQTDRQTDRDREKKHDLVYLRGGRDDRFDPRRVAHICSKGLIRIT